MPSVSPKKSLRDSTAARREKFGSCMGTILPDAIVVSVALRPAAMGGSSFIDPSSSPNGLKAVR